MRSSCLMLVLAALPTFVAAQQPTSRPAPGLRIATVTGGIGNAMGWFGAQGERYFWGGRASVFAGVGITPSFFDGSRTGPSGAVGVRGFTAGSKHRAFAELSVSQVAVETAPNTPSRDGSFRYGPGVQVGYQLVSRGGFTFLTSAGLGYAIGTSPGLNRWQGLMGLGVGYTWRR